jgi:hypothetical protein
LAVLLFLDVDPRAAVLLFLAAELLLAEPFLAAELLLAVDFVPVLLRADDFRAVDVAPLDDLAPPVARPAVDRTRESATLPSRTAPLTTPLNCVPGLNLGTDVFLIRTVAPVCGFRPVRALRSAFSKTPNPLSATRCPLATARVISSVTV